MPTPFTSSFASAAAGSNGDMPSNKRDSGPGDWSRRPNGTTHTFRRPSANATPQARDSTQQNAPNTGVYVPPHLNSSHPAHAYHNGTSADTRYRKDQLLDVFQNQKDSGSLDRDLQDLFLGSWDPASNDNGVSVSASKDQYPGPEVCWDYGAGSTPLGLIEMSEEERHLFTSSVNAPVKTVPNSKESGGAGPASARKASLSGYSTTSGTASRPGTRRRDTSDSFVANGPLSPTESKPFFRNESSAATPPPALLRRRTDYKDDEPSPDQRDKVREEQQDSQIPFGSLRRVGTAPTNASVSATSPSPWSAGPNTSGFGSMGSFGSFNVAPTSQNQESAEKRPGFGSARGSSRFKDLLAKTSSEDVSGMGRDKGGFSGLEKLPEEEAAHPSQASIQDMFKTRPNRSETNPYDEAPVRSGSAAMGPSQDELGQMGFASMAGGPSFGQGESGYHQSAGRFNEPMSPANTNPYQSPQGNQQHRENEGEINDSGSQPMPPFGPGRRSLFSESDDRNSLASRGSFGGLPGFGGLGGGPTWSAAGINPATTARERSLGSSAFADPIFSPLSDMQSPGAGFFGGGPFGSAGRSNRLGAMFPPAMQDQMRGDEASGPLFSSRPESAHQNAGMRDPFDSNFARASGAFDDSTSARGVDEPPAGLGAPGQASAIAQSVPDRTSTGSESGQQPPLSDNGSQMPATQQRQMVMPDRMRWIYRDPQGTIQGPWSGLEMHDWFKAGFFTAELLVKKVEDSDFEPLAQLVRRIGNSREPFLVPQIGVPHGPTSATAATAWPNPPATAAPPPGNAQPPFASAFPSFGTTLTAEQQNALERRKQEEQYLMARQKEHLAQQQVYMKQMSLQNGPHNMQSLQHHSSAQSLHSQPSFGSITSPTGFHPSPMPPSQHQMGPPPSSGQQQPPFSGRPEELPSFIDRLSFNERMQLPPGTGPLGAQSDQSPQVTQMLQDRARLQQQQQQQGAHQEAFLGQPGRNDRLEEFNELRGQDDGRPAHEQILQPIGAQRDDQKPPAPIGYPGAIQKPQPEPSLTQQVQRTAALQEERAIQPPPMSISPLPAPAAQRNRQHVADALAQESTSETAIETPAASLAPWAERTNEASKGPSLREIQEAEAKKAAEQETLAAEARRMQMEHERLTQITLSPPAPGLPSTSTWGQSGSPGTPTTPATSVWAKQATKPSAVPTSQAKRTLAQIQKEEESRKQRATAAAAAAASAQAANSPVSAALQGKRYAELASKAAPTSPASANVNAAWTTVGTGGKAKTPATIVATPQTVPRAVSSTISAQVKGRPMIQTARSSNLTEKSRAHEEFTKWLRAQLGKGLNSGINVDNFVQDLLMLPPEAEIIADSVYASSQTLDGRRIADEFVRRRKLAENGIIEPVLTSATPGMANGGEGKSIGGGGWSEVAKKGPEKKEESNAQFKVVSKKKGKR